MFPKKTLKSDRFLRSGGWQDGCLRGHSLANETTNMSLVLNFDRRNATDGESGHGFLHLLHGRLYMR